MAKREWSEVLGDAVARLGPRAAFRILQGGWEVGHALTGRRPQMRTRFLDSSMFGGEFEASADAVRRRVDDVFDVVEHEPGRTMISVTALDHRRIDLLPPYRELAVTVPVQYLGEPGDLVLEMPVTSERARWGGVMAYGFPKIVADIRISEDATGRVCRVRAEGRHVLTLRVALTPAGRRVPFALHQYNVRGDDQVVGSVFRGTGEIGRSDEPAGATLELGEHAMGVGLRALALASISRAHLDAPHITATLGKGEELGFVARPIPRPPERRRRWIARPAT